MCRHPPRNQAPHSMHFSIPVILLLLCTAMPATADEFVSKRGMPDKILIKNIERLVNNVMTQSFDPEQRSTQVTRILGKEDLGFSKVKVWFCVSKTKGDKKANVCGDDVRLIRLDSGIWILRDEKSGSWIVAQE